MERVEQIPRNDPHPSNGSVRRECTGTAAHRTYKTLAKMKTQASSTHALPSFTAIPAPNFQWSEKHGEYLMQIVDHCYDEAVHWRRNLFKIPSGKAGVAFLQELSRLFQAYVESSALEGVALKAAMILPALLLQKPHARWRTKEHTKHLEHPQKLGRMEI